MSKGTKSLRRTEKKLPVHSYVEDLVDKLGKQDRIPRGILESEVFESARARPVRICSTGGDVQSILLLRDASSRSTRHMRIYRHVLR